MKWLSCCLLLLGLSGVRGFAFDLTHARFAKVLARHVQDGMVNYAALKAAPDDLDVYLKETSGVDEKEFQAWARPDQIAFLINLYNATTIRLILDNYPVTSIRRIGGFLGTPWAIECVSLFGKKTTLNYVEHEFLRPKYKEPRVHFALVCAAKSCPPLRSEPYVGSKLEAQLLDQGKRFFAQEQKNRFDPVLDTLILSPIFNWYEGDFPRDPRALAGFLSPFFSKAAANAMCDGTFRIRYSSYDWSLNDQAGRNSKP